jgi:hypothetical protein
MAGRSFNKQVQKLYLDDYQGAHIPHFMDVLTDANEILLESRVRGPLRQRPLDNAAARLKILCQAALADGTGKKLGPTLAELNLRPGGVL